MPFNNHICKACLKYGDAGFRLFDKDLNQAEVVSMLLGYTAMPFEANPALFQSISAPPNAQNMLRQMLQRNPTARPALKDVSGLELFTFVVSLCQNPLCV